MGDGTAEEAAAGDGRASRTTKKAAAKARQQTEMASEKRPRPRDMFLQQQQKATKLAKIGPDGGPAGEGEIGIGEEKRIGKKTRKKMQVLATKNAKKEQAKSLELAKQHEKASKDLKSKAKVIPGRMKAAARDLLANMKNRTPAAEQRMLAMVAERISAKPEEEMELFDFFFELHQTSKDKQTRQLALLSAVAVFRDLVPGYRIREDRDKESTAKNKITLSLEKHEMTILQTYRRMFPLLEQALKLDAMGFAPALGALIKAASDFNYQQRLIQVAVRHANSHLESVRRIVGDALSEVIAGDFRLDASKHVVLAIGGIAQMHASNRGSGNDVHPELLHILLRLPVGRAEEAELHGDPNLADADDEMRRNLSEGSIRHGVDKLRKGEAELLYEVFCVYLRILRQRGAHSRDLIAAALGGLSKWGQQVNLELLLEILRELKLTVQEAMQAMDERVALQGLHCALVLLSGPAKALVTDATWIPDALVGALRIALPSLYSTHSDGHWPPRGSFHLDDDKLSASKEELAFALEEGSMPCLVLKTLEAAMRCSHGFGGASDGQLAGLCEELGLLAAGADSHVSVAILREVAALFRKYRKLQTLLDVEGGLFGLGGVTDRALCIAWPMHVLAASLAPWPRKIGLQLAETVASRRSLLTDIFPNRDGKLWLEAEFPMHLVGLHDAPRPGLLPQAPVKADSDAEAAEDEEEPEEAAAESGKDGRIANGGTGAISRKKRRRATFLSEEKLRRALRIE